MFTMIALAFMALIIFPPLGAMVFVFIGFTLFPSVMVVLSVMFFLSLIAIIVYCIIKLFE